MGELSSREIDNLAARLVTQVETGNLAPWTRELNELSLEERLAVVRRADEINEQHRSARPDQHLPDIVISEVDSPGFGANSKFLYDVGAVGADEQAIDLYDPPVFRCRPVFMGSALERARECMAKGQLGKAEQHYLTAVDSANKMDMNRVFQELSNLDRRLKDDASLSELERHLLIEKRKQLVDIKVAPAAIRLEYAATLSCQGKHEKASQFVREALLLSGIEPCEEECKFIKWSENLEVLARLGDRERLLVAVRASLMHEIEYGSAAPEVYEYLLGRLYKRYDQAEPGR